MGRVEVEGAAVGGEGVADGARLQLVAQLVPVLGVEVAALRGLGDGLAPERRGALGQLGDREAGELLEVAVGERPLAGLRLPHLAAVAGHHLATLGGDADGGQRPAAGELLAQPGERAAHPVGRDAGRAQPLGGAQDHQVLEGVAERAAGAAGGGEEAGGDEGAHLPLGKAEQGRHLVRRVGGAEGHRAPLDLGRPRAYSARRLSCPARRLLPAASPSSPPACAASAWRASSPRSRRGWPSGRPSGR